MQNQEKESVKASGITFGSSNITFGSQSSNTAVDASSEESAKVSGITFGSSNITFGSQSSNTAVDASSVESAKVSGITFGSSNITFGSQSSNTTVDASSEESAKVSGITFGGSATTFGSQSTNASKANFGSGKVTFGNQSSTAAQEGGFSFGSTPKPEKQRSASPYCNGIFFWRQIKAGRAKRLETRHPRGLWIYFWESPKARDSKTSRCQGHGEFAFGSLPGTTKLADAKDDNGPKAYVTKGVAIGANVVAKETKVPEGLHQSGVNNVVSSLQVDVSSASISYGNFDSFVEDKKTINSEKTQKPKQEENFDKPLFAFTSPEKKEGDVASKIERLTVL